MAAVRALPPGELARPTGISPHSILGTMTHLHFADWIWYTRVAESVEKPAETLEALARDWPEQLPLYDELYANGRAYMPNDVTSPVRMRVAQLAAEHEVGHTKRRTREPPPEPKQLALL